ncbi:uncharacterized protein [Rutidosis leptorrhynchoides]|uniref:uncharacterized protein isoform X1 n=1 Tax=Rutidosis leptorrhynchoides TaxID=125765 RepID=UPI003A99ED3F
MLFWILHVQDSKVFTLFPSMAEDGVVLPSERNCKLPIFVFFKDLRLVLKMDSLGKEILTIAVPAAMALAADPIASLIDTAFIGRIGPVEIAAVGVSIAIFNQVSKVAIFPLVSITTSFVAEEETIERINSESTKLEKTWVSKRETNELKQDDVKLENLENDSTVEDEKTELAPDNNSFKTSPCKHVVTIESNSNGSKVKRQKRNIPSASTALFFGAVLGLVETLLLVLLAKPLLSLMGVKTGSPMLLPAHRYLSLRALGAPAVLLSLAMQGVFRGFKDTKTPLYATVAGDVANIILDPILIFACKLGVSGAAIAHVLSQYLISAILFVKLMQQVDLLPPSIKALQFSRFLQNGFLLLFKVIAATICVTLAASLAARLGSTPMAAFQICLQVWLTSSLLADGLAVAGQAIIASSFAEKNYEKATAAAARVLQMGFIMGLGLALLVGLGLKFGSGVFTKDINVKHIITIGVPFVAGTQPINSIAFVYDGVNFGASDFAYSAYSMILVAIGSIGSLLALYKAGGFVGIWVALSIFMGLRAIAGIWSLQILSVKRLQVPIFFKFLHTIRLSTMAEENSVAPIETKKPHPIFVFFKDIRLVLKMDSLGKEILTIAVPAAMAFAADPVASLIDTAFIGHIGPVEIAAVGVSIAIFNQVSKVAIFPLVSITTSFVAEEETLERLESKVPKVENEDKSSKNTEETKELMTDDVKVENLENGSTIKDDKKELALKDGFKTSPSNHVTITPKKSTFKRKKRNIPSASTALLIGAVLGILETLLLVFLAEPLLSLMGVRHGSKMLLPAHKYLTLRALGAPAVLLSLAMQGVFRGFKDTKTPLYATVIGDVANIILDPILIFVCNLGVSGAAIAHVLSQYLISIILLVKLMNQVDLLPPSLKALQLSRFLKNGLLLLFKVLAATSCVTLAASLATRLGTTPMAAFQICLQVWLTSSLLADGLAVAGQAIIATSFAEKNYEKATAAAARVLQMGFIMGLGLAFLVGLGLQFGSGMFTKDINVKHIITIGIPFVAGTQPINSIAFIFDGVNFGASDFAYSAYSMIVVAIASIGSIFALYKAGGFVGIWIALSIFMGLRALAGIWRMGTGTGPWVFLRK